MSTANESLSNLGDRQQALLRELRRGSDGLTVDELLNRLGVTRTAVNQHLRSLEEKGYVARGSLRGAAGRPSRTYLLTSKGLELFPRQYSWFSSLLLSKLKRDFQPDQLVGTVRQLALEVAQGIKPQLERKSLALRVPDIVGMMTELGYEARDATRNSAFPIIEAENCVYHSLAREHPEVCEFDLQLLETLSDARVVHEECVLRGGRCCRFRFEPS